MTARTPERATPSRPPAADVAARAAHPGAGAGTVAATATVRPRPPQAGRTVAPSVPGASMPKDVLAPGLQAIAKAMSEEELLAKITLGVSRREPGICKQLGLAWYHPRDSRRSNEGWPDLVIGNDNQVVFWELKTETGKVTPAQDAWLRRLAAGGCTVGVRRPRDYVSGRIARELAALAGLGVARA